jgi:hypothetical protein
MKALDPFETTDKGMIKLNQHNIRWALLKLGAAVSYDSFHDRAVLIGLNGFDTLDDKALVRLRLRIDEEFDFLPPPTLVWTNVCPKPCALLPDINSH